jgi:hypothetical protein
MKKNAHVYLIYAIAVIGYMVASCGTIPVVERAAVPVTAGTAVVFLLGGAPALVVSAGAAFVAWVATVLVESSNAPPAPGAPALPWYLHPGYWVLGYVLIRNHEHILTLFSGGLRAIPAKLGAMIAGGKLGHVARAMTASRRRVQPPVLVPKSSTTGEHS